MGVVYCLHGFLGQPQDWDFLDPLPLTLEKVDLFKILPPSPHLTPTDWARAFNGWVKTQGSGPRSLLGYSMGGRLALHSLFLEPGLWNSAIFVSTHPGLPQEQRKERLMRLEQDKNWSKRFENDDWDQLIADWDQLAVFGGRRQTLNRLEENFNRADLAGALQCWSTGLQDDFSSQIINSSVPISWVIGEEDAKYQDLARRLIAPASSLSIIRVPGACHRVPWENPRFFCEHFCSFLDRTLINAPHPHNKEERGISS